MHDETRPIGAGRRATDPATSGNQVAIYVGAIVTLAMTTIFSIVAISFARPDFDNASINTVIVGVVSPLLLGLLGLILRENHRALNSRLDQFLAATARLHQAQGQREGRAAAREEQAVDLASLADATAKLKIADAEALAKVLEARLAAEHPSQIETESVSISAQTVSVVPSAERDVARRPAPRETPEY